MAGGIGALNMDESAQARVAPMTQFPQLSIKPPRVRPGSKVAIVSPAAPGGCLETICWHLKGTTDWLDLTGAVLMLEPSENCFIDVTSPAFIDAHLSDLARLGVFDH